MNAVVTAPKKTICSKCKAISDEVRKPVGSACDNVMLTKRMGKRQIGTAWVQVPVVDEEACEGTYDLTNGEKFKGQFGYSKSMKKNMQKHGVTSLEEYREIRKKARRERAKITAKKHSDAKAGRVSKPKGAPQTKGKKGQPAAQAA